MTLNNDIEIQKYWDDRAQKDKSVQATTNDICLRELEISTFVSEIEKLNLPDGARILDLGCGDGYTTINIAKKLNKKYKYYGIDYSEHMINNAVLNKETIGGAESEINFSVGDAIKIEEIVNSEFNGQKFDVILTDRCLINIPSGEKQYETIKQINKCLNKDGVYIAIENFTNGQNNFNELRRQFNLSEIPVRWHNFFFEEDKFFTELKDEFKSIEIFDFSSSYYIATRIIYSAICKIEGREPDYSHEINELALSLPPLGEYSPIKLAVLKKGN